MPHTVLISHPMLSLMQARLEAKGYRVVRRWEMADGEAQAVEAIVHAGEIYLTADFLESLTNLKLIANVSVGYDGVDVPWCRARGIEVSHADGLNAEDVADHALGLLIGGWRNIVAGDRMLRAGRWNHDRLEIGPGLKGQRVGIMGLGHIGVAVARRVEAFGMTVAWWGPNEKPDAAWPRAESLLALAQDSDILVVACRADVSNRQAVNAEVIEAVGAKGMIVNVARGSVIDEDALIAALKAGRLGRAGLDVFATEPTPTERWEGVPNTVLTPHSAGGTVDSLPSMIGQTFENLRRHFAGEALLSPVA
ncbi:MAG: 2-hydroxyacid dehydrogenase [Phenylobacterium sp.]|uniref:2-hydroxyacid dehydrogenase n=1 Tax=Phenylobacterium sp. TaxID=1871053 RepID=UPI002716F4FC|nr:2-hydroxyacid dehydrogenase [Phenylobacterium sp.]MDO8912651.1 2-hydroxyacid dehydrogenase [Phenylobacterium sp.]MDP3101917.1 2-hydroxyacid dehydrogenase [Phenylobacterium sp.]